MVLTEPILLLTSIHWSVKCTNYLRPKNSFWKGYMCSKASFCSNDYWLWTWTTILIQKWVATWTTTKVVAQLANVRVLFFPPLLEVICLKRIVLVKLVNQSLGLLHAITLEVLQWRVTLPEISSYGSNKICCNKWALVRSGLEEKLHWLPLIPWWGCSDGLLHPRSVVMAQTEYVVVSERYNHAQRRSYIDRPSPLKSGYLNSALTQTLIQGIFSLHTLYP